MLRTILVTSLDNNNVVICFCSKYHQYHTPYHYLFSLKRIYLITFRFIWVYLHIYKTNVFNKYLMCQHHNIFISYH